ncbi:hypothetical protein Leryth_013034 [Lithospermum erythrorhizon]|nr:hypothetical protein Leryth_013034 [Lithospermum erythrorhizon]
MNRLLKSPAKSRFYLIAAAATGGAATNTFHYLNPNHSSSTFLNGVVRSSRALFTVTRNVVDYKYSLHGLLPDSDEYVVELSKVNLRSARRTLKLCETNRGFYVKAGQFAAAVRQVPKEYSLTLSSLRDQVHPCQFNLIKEVLVKNLGPNFSDVFISFDEQPIAAASIAQVHHAVMKGHGEVAVKVQYPGLESQMKFDFATMNVLSKTIAWFFPEYRFGWLVEAFANSVVTELDFIQEAKHTERMAENFRNNKMVEVPRIYWDHTTRQVLTMQFCEGKKVNDLEFLKLNGISPVKVAKVLAEVCAEMIFVHGFLHGDLHPGNILVSPKGNGRFSLVLLDHGICKQLDEDFRENYCQLWKALIFMDSNKIQQIGDQFGAGKYSRFFPVIFTGRPINSKSALGRGMSAEEKKILRQELKSLKMEDVSSFMESLPPDFLSVLRTDGLLRSLISNLGASQQARLLAYAKYAMHSLYLRSNATSGFKMQATFTRFRNGVKYIQWRLILELLGLFSWIEGKRGVFTQLLKHIHYSISNYLKSLLPLSRILIV